jgi:hypothetical protein
MSGVPVRVTTLVFDSHDAERLAAFWAGALGWDAQPPGGDGWVVVAPTDGSSSFILLFVPVPEAKVVKNRVHIDVNPLGGDAEGELERLLGLGAQRADVGQTTDEDWTVLADPEGNEFCLLHRPIDA